MNAVCQRVNVSMPVRECDVPASACGVRTPLTLESEPVHNHLPHSTASATQHTNQHTNQESTPIKTYTTPTSTPTKGQDQSRRTQHQPAHQLAHQPRVNTNMSCVPRCLSRYADRNPPTPAAADSKVADCCTQRQDKAVEHAGWLVGDLFLEYHL